MTRLGPRWRLTKTIWNERIKLLATSLNAVGLAIFGFGVLGPTFSAATTSSDVQIMVCSAIFGALHVASQ